MSYQIHTNARTTSTTRKEIQTSIHFPRVLANEFGGLTLDDSEVVSLRGRG